MRGVFHLAIIALTFLITEGRLLSRTTDRTFVTKNDDFKSVAITKHCLHDHQSHERDTTSYVKRSADKAQIPLVKKPIPTFVEMNYEDDYQTRKIRWPEKYSESSENEDVDFNVDDYEFDVNHDEFSSRGKPLVPRVKPLMLHNKPMLEKELKFIPKTTPIALELLNEATDKYKTLKKRNRINKNEKELSINDYDDLTTSQTEKKIVYNQEEIGEDAEGECARKSSKRRIRSPWELGVYMDKLGEKTTSLVNKLLGILPMFPQIPQRKNV